MKVLGYEWLSGPVMGLSEDASLCGLVQPPGQAKTYKGLSPKRNHVAVHRQKAWTFSKNYLFVLKILDLVLASLICLLSSSLYLETLLILELSLFYSASLLPLTPYATVNIPSAASRGYDLIRRVVPPPATPFGKSNYFLGVA
jgi:hypothetical protein